MRCGGGVLNALTEKDQKLTGNSNHHELPERMMSICVKKVFCWKIHVQNPVSVRWYAKMREQFSRYPKIIIARKLFTFLVHLLLLCIYYVHLQLVCPCTRNPFNAVANIFNAALQRANVQNTSQPKMQTCTGRLQ